MSITRPFGWSHPYLAISSHMPNKQTVCNVRQVCDVHIMCIFDSFIHHFGYDWPIGSERKRGGTLAIRHLCHICLSGEAWMECFLDRSLYRNPYRIMKNSLMRKPPTKLTKTNSVIFHSNNHHIRWDRCHKNHVLFIISMVVHFMDIACFGWPCSRLPINHVVRNAKIGHFVESIWFGFGSFHAWQY